MKKLLVFVVLIMSFIPAHAYAYGSANNAKYYLKEYTLCVLSNGVRMTHNPGSARSVASRILNYCQSHLNRAAAEFPDQSSANAFKAEARAGYFDSLVTGIIRDRRGY